jgi:hypothetical protein
VRSGVLFGYSEMDDVASIFMAWHWRPKNLKAVDGELSFVAPEIIKLGNT